MAGHAGAGRLPEIDAEVHPLRGVGFADRRFGGAREHDQLAQLVVGRLGQRRHVAVRHHHQMRVVVGEQVEDDVAGGAAKDDQRRRVVVRERTAEDAGIGFTAAADVGEPPRGPEAFHCNAEL